MLYPSDILQNVGQPSEKQEVPIENIYHQSAEYIFELNVNTRILNIYILHGISHDTHKYIALFAAITSLTDEYEIHVWINSPGGSLATGYMILSALNKSPASVHTHNLALAASCGSLILCVGDTIDIAPYAVTMFHNASMGIAGDVNFMKQQVEFCIKEVESLTMMFMDKGILTEQEVDAIISGREFYFTKEQMDTRLSAAGLLPKGGVV